MHENNPHVLATFAIYFLKLLVKNALLFELVVFLVQHECRQSIFNRVVCLCLNVFLQDIPGQEAKRKSPMTAFNEVQVHSIDNLLWRNKYVWRTCELSESNDTIAARTDDAEIF